MLIFINKSTPAGKGLVCEPVGIYGRKESEEGFQFFKALGKILKNKLKGKPWDDFFVVNIGKIKRQVDAQLRDTASMFLESFKAEKFMIGERNLA